jgi:hypothetical protein
VKYSLLPSNDTRYHLNIKAMVLLVISIIFTSGCLPEHKVQVSGDVSIAKGNHAIPSVTYGPWQDITVGNQFLTYRSIEDENGDWRGYMVGETSPSQPEPITPFKYYGIAHIKPDEFMFLSKLTLDDLRELLKHEQRLADKPAVDKVLKK